MEIVKESGEQPREDTLEELQEFIEKVHDHVGEEAEDLLIISALLRELSDDAKFSAKELRGLGAILEGIGNTIEGELPPD